MKALSIRQPWAWLIVHGFKDIENRTWSPAFRGQFAVHAGKAFDLEGYHFVGMRFPWIKMPIQGGFRRGGFVGVATLTDVVTESESWWFSGPLGFVLADSRPLDFIAAPGRLGFFETELGDGWLKERGDNR